MCKFQQYSALRDLPCSETQILPILFGDTLTQFVKTKNDELLREFLAVKFVKDTSHDLSEKKREAGPCHMGNWAWM